MPLGVSSLAATAATASTSAADPAVVGGPDFLAADETPTGPLAWWRRWEVPTWIVAFAIYGAWIGLVVFQAWIPWPVLMLAAAYVLAWHFSLQHEAIHSWRSLPLWLRTAIVWPPIGGWLPYELYRRSHSIHHRDENITFPGVDTESVYHRPEDWVRYPRSWRAVLMVNQTLAGRLAIGPLLRLRKLALTEWALLRRRDFGNLAIWARFAIGLAAVLWFVTAVGRMSIARYYLLFVYPGLSLGLLRAFIEHRWGARPQERIAVVESNWVFGLLFLWNNIHVVHHLRPSLSWYEIPGAYRRDRERFLAINGAYRFSGYGEIARRWLFRPAFVPVHPAAPPPA